MIFTQQYLRNHTLDELCDEYKVHIRRHYQHPNLISFKYGIGSPMDKEVTRECRGLILDEADNWRIVSYPFRKFFNLHEFYADPIDWSSAEITEKMDGSLISIYNYDDIWYCSTTGTPDGSAIVSPISDMTFADLFWKTFINSDYEYPDENFCYMFELTSPYNRIVVPYKESSLTLIGVRSIKTLKEQTLDVGYEYDWNVVRSFNLGGLGGLLEASKVLDPMKSEGYVVRDKAFNRVKVKGPRYVELHHLKSSITFSGLLDVIRQNETNELLAYFPDIAGKVDKIKALYDALIEKIDKKYKEVSMIEDRKEFALAVYKLHYSWVLFGMRDSGLSAIEVLNNAKQFQVKNLFDGEYRKSCELQINTP